MTSRVGLCLFAAVALHAQAPTVTNISPFEGPYFGGTNVTITGTGFVNGATVALGGTLATNVIVMNATIISARTAAHTAGTVNVVVTNPNLQSGTLSQGYLYLPLNFTNISPNFGATAGGTNVTLTGTSFQNGATVTLGGVAATNVIVVDHTTITATTGPHAAGLVNVMVTNPNTDSSTLVNGFLYGVAVSQITATSGPTTGGTPFYIFGNGFLPGATVTIGGVAATNVNVWNPNQITATTGAHAAGTVDVVVTNPNGDSGTLVNGFTYIVQAPTVSSISPNSGPPAGGTHVLILGAAFATGATVALGGVAATNVNVVSPSVLTATTGAHAVGTVNVVVTNPDMMSGTLMNGFTYQLPPPQVTAIAPISGPPAGSTNVTISGAAFVTGATVALGGVAATNVIVVNPNQITATTGAHAEGVVDVVVTNPDMQSGTLPMAYIYGVTNDNFADRFTLSGNNVTATGSNVAFTAEPDEPADVFYVVETRSAWWTWTAPCSFRVTEPMSFMDTIGSDFDTVLGVFTGSSLNALTLFASDDDSGGDLTSRVPSTNPGPSRLKIVAGTVFQIRVRGYSIYSFGSITLHINTPCATPRRSQLISD